MRSSYTWNMEMCQGKHNCFTQFATHGMRACTCNSALTYAGLGMQEDVLEYEVELQCHWMQKKAAGVPVV
jgi:hypothetical protein